MTEYDRAVVSHGLDHSERFEMNPGIAHQSSAFLEPFFDHDPRAGRLGAGRPHKRNQAEQSLSFCEKIVDNQDSFAGVEKFL